MTRILVTGGAGFIGSEFVRQVLRTRPQDRVTVFDKLTYSGVRENLAAVADHPGFTFVLGDVCDPTAVDRAMAGQDAVVNFAAESHVDRSIQGAEDFVRTNVLGTQVLLDAARRHRVGRFVQVSTDEVYGSIDTGSWTEQQPLAPNSPYAASKAAADLLALACHRTHGLDVVVTRCSNNYGPHQFPEKLIPLFTTRLLDRLPVGLYGDGRNVRDWLHVEDHCRAVALVLERGRAGEVYHIGGGTEISNLGVTELLLAALDADPDLVKRVPDRKGHDLRYALNAEKIRTELGFEPRIGFADGLARTVAWYRDHRGWWEPLHERAALG